MSTQRNGLPQTGFEALAYQLRAGPAALHDSSAQQRLFAMSRERVREIATRLTRPRWNLTGTGRVPPWPRSDIDSLLEMWSKGDG
jgi:hypothetical protein